MSIASDKKKERVEAIERLRGDLVPGSVVYTVLRKRSSSGMTRHISVHAIDGGRIADLTWNVGKALGYRVNNDTGGLVVGGCGMDMGFHVVYSLGRALFPEGFKVAEGRRGRNGDTSGWGKDGGYALEHRWL